MVFPTLPHAEQTCRLTYPPQVPMGAAVFAAIVAPVQARGRATRSHTGALR